MAVIDTAAFDRRPGGILRLVRAIEPVQMEFLHCYRGRTRSECETAFERRLREVIEPVMNDITKHLEEFARQKGIGLLLDKSGTRCALPCRWEVLADRDITEEFIREYNRLNP